MLTSELLETAETFLNHLMLDEKNAAWDEFPSQIRRLHNFSERAEKDGNRFFVLKTIEGERVGYVEFLSPQHRDRWQQEHCRVWILNYPAMLILNELIGEKALAKRIYQILQHNFGIDKSDLNCFAEMGESCIEIHGFYRLNDFLIERELSM